MKIHTVTLPTYYSMNKKIFTVIYGNNKTIKFEKYKRWHHKIDYINHMSISFWITKQLSSNLKINVVLEFIILTIDKNVNI